VIWERTPYGWSASVPGWSLRAWQVDECGFWWEWEVSHRSYWVDVGDRARSLSEAQEAAARMVRQMERDT
jgi:hypothetical protein